MLTLTINGRTHKVAADPKEPLLWVIRERLQLTGTKFGCGAGICGACTVHIDGKARRSCQVAAGDAVGKSITTIEGLAADHPVKQAWLEEQVPQCGYCQPGQIMQATALLGANPDPTDAQIDAGMDGNLCRCGTYQGIRKAVRGAAKRSKKP